MSEIPLPPVASLEATTSRDEIAELLLDYTAQLARRVVLLVLRGGSLLVVDSRGTALGLYEVGRLILPLSPSSIFSTVVSTATTFRGRLSDTPVESAWAERLGGIDGEALVAPILARGRAIAALYADGWSGPLAEGPLQTALLAAGNAYERLLVARKQKQTPVARPPASPEAAVPRRHPRYAVALTCRVRHAGERYECRSFDLSHGGICLRLGVPLAIGDTVELEVEFSMAVADGEASKSLSLRAAVVWCTRLKGAHQFVGLKFVELDAETEQEIDGFLRHLDPTPDFQPLDRD